MRCLLFLFLIGFTLTGATSEARFIKTQIPQMGPDEEAVWAYLGFVPRMNDPERLEIVVSARGMTVRASAVFTVDEIAKYGDYLVQRARAIQAIREGRSAIEWEGRSVTTPFVGVDEAAFERFFEVIDTEVRPTLNAGYQANLQLLADFFPGSVFATDSHVHLHLVLPTTPPSGPPEGVEEGTFTINHLEERRTYYSEDDNHIFAGFPAFWFFGEVGLHGPIRYSGHHSRKTWQLVRRPNSNGCFRLEHIHHLRHLLPASPARARQVPIRVIQDFDHYDLVGDDTPEIIGVKYYRTQPGKKPDPENWKKTNYQSKRAEQIYEFELLDPDVAQIIPLAGSDGHIRPNATSAHLNRAPEGMRSPPPPTPPLDNLGAGVRSL